MTVPERADASLVESGSPWVGRLPRSWSVTRLGRDVRISEGQVDPRVEPWASMVLIAPNHIESGTSRILGLESATEQGADSGKYRVRAGQVVYSKIRPALNKVTIAPLDCLCSADMYPFSVDPDVVDRRFLVYWILARPFATFASLTADRVKMPKVNREEVGAAPWVRAPLDEQRRIADFLDRETSRVDRLIARQEQLISGLRERRDAMWTSRFVGVAERSPLVSLRRMALSVIDGPFGSSLKSEHYTSTGTRVIRLGNIGVDLFKDRDRSYISNEYAAELSEFAARPGDVVIAGLGDDNNPVGRAAVVPDIGPAMVKADCFRVRPAPNTSGDYLAWALSAPPSRARIRTLARGSTRQRINVPTAKTIELPLPERSRQEQIVAASRRETAKVDTLVAKAEELIALAQERRATLITEAVTGRIDVATGKAREGA